MSEIIGDGPRIKFACRYAGPIPESLTISLPFHKTTSWLAAMLAKMERAGLTPILDDQLVGGNGAVRVGAYVLVSKSGKRPGEQLTAADFVLIEDFDRDAWSCTYRSCAESVRPTSDTPLLWGALHHCEAQAALHGHGIDNDRDADYLQCPITGEATLFSTPEDLAGFQDMVTSHPGLSLYLRRGHGFFVVHREFAEAAQIVEKILIPYVEKRGL